ncbi:MAG: hypothetical protein K8963_02345, partial [Proteobacteria bacterium]|nr:hypothetical protein [Pseudomonadota bacterium]
MRKIFIGLTIMLAIIWTPFLIWPLIIVSGEYAKTAVDWLQAYTRDSESESFVDTQVGKYHLEIPRRFIRNDSTLVFGPEVNNTNPVELAVKMVIPAQEMAAAVPGYSARVGYLPLDLLFYISAPSTKTLNKDLSPNFFNNLWRGEGAFRNSVVQPDSAVGLYRIYSGMHMSELSRDTGLPVRWTYTSLPPDPFFSVPKDPLGFWVAACKTGQWLRLDHYSQDAAVCHAKLFASGLYVTIDLHGTNFHLLESIKSFLAASIQKWISANAQPPGVSHEQDGNTDPSEPTVTDRPNSDVGPATTKRTGSDVEPATTKRTGSDADYFTQQSPSAEATARLAEKSHSSPPAHHWQLSPETSAGIVSIGPGGEAALEQLVQGAAFTGAQAHSWFGRVMAISADGSTLAVGAPSQDGAERSGSCDPGLTHSRFRWVGAVYLYRRAREGGWRYDDCLRPTRASKHESFASSIALSADGSTLAVGAPGAKPIERKHNKELFFGPDGAVYLYKRHRGTWTDIQRIEPEQSYASTNHIHFGASVGLSADGNTLAVGAPADDFNKPGIQHFAQSPPPEEPIYQRNKFSGAVYMYIWDDA